MTGDWRLLTFGLVGELLVIAGTAVQAVGLWRSRALPRWIPVLSQLIGYHAWRRCL